MWFYIALISYQITFGGRGIDTLTFSRPFSFRFEAEKYVASRDSSDNGEKIFFAAGGEFVALRKIRSGIDSVLYKKRSGIDFDFNAMVKE